jgi:hypothetical protein
LQQTEADYALRSPACTRARTRGHATDRTLDLRRHRTAVARRERTDQQGMKNPTERAAASRSELRQRRWYCDKPGSDRTSWSTARTHMCTHTSLSLLKNPCKSHGPGRIRTCDPGIKVLPHELHLAASNGKALQIGPNVVAASRARSHLAETSCTRTRTRSPGSAARRVVGQDQQASTDGRSATSRKGRVILLRVGGSPLRARNGSRRVPGVLSEGVVR